MATLACRHGCATRTTHRPLSAGWERVMWTLPSGGGERVAQVIGYYSCGVPTPYSTKSKGSSLGKIDAAAIMQHK